jgi:hypothetical protein
VITALAAIAGIFVGIWATIKYLVLLQMRLDANTFKTLYEIGRSEKKFVLYEEFVSEVKTPLEFAAICNFQGAPFFYISHAERMLTGYEAKDMVTSLTCLRWQGKRMRQYLRESLKTLQLEKLGLPVELITPNYTDRIGTIKKSFGPPVIDASYWQDIDEEVGEVAAGTRPKTGMLLYGPPGNGKTSFVRYLATKYQLPIKIMAFSPDYRNADLMFMFAQITSRCIVLFEDFDNQFDGRKCILGSGNNGIKFSFDVILNGLDGIYNTYENVVFIMTVNELSKVDYALKNRPSRFKYLREFKDPDADLRRKMLPEDWVEGSEGLNLDQIFRLKEFGERGDNLTEALAKLEKKVTEEQIRAAAHARYLERVEKKIKGDEEKDWAYARAKLGCRDEEEDSDDDDDEEDDEDSDDEEDDE